MKFYGEMKPLFLETDASIVGLGACLLQTREGTSCPRYEAPGNSILRPSTFASKSLSVTEERYNTIESEALGKIHGLEKFIITALPKM